MRWASPRPCSGPAHPALRSPRCAWRHLRRDHHGGLQSRTVVSAEGNANPSRLMAAMTAAFAAGQIAGPLSVSLLVSAGGAAGGIGAALLIACAVLLAGAVLLKF